MLMEITDVNFDEKVKSESSPFVLVFSSPWCGICKKVVPCLESLSKKYGKAKFGKIDITTNTQKPSAFQVLSIPTVIIFKEGEEKERTVGEVSEEELIQTLDRVL